MFLKEFKPVKHGGKKLLYALLLVDLYMTGDGENSFNHIANHLSTSDPVMAELIKSIGECTLAKAENYYLSLLASIINQQLSGSAADSIHRRLTQEAGGELNPRNIFILSPEQFRRAGVSRSKEDFIRRLSAVFSEDVGFLNDIDQKTDDEILSILTGLKGIGPWTAHMFMIFSLNRLDVLPIGDAGFRRAVSKFYLNGARAEDPEIIKIAEKWRPYRSIAVWYLWRGIDGAPKGPIQRSPASLDGFAEDL